MKPSMPNGYGDGRHGLATWHVCPPKDGQKSSPIIKMLLGGDVNNKNPKDIAIAKLEVLFPVLKIPESAITPLTTTGSKLPKTERNGPNNLKFTAAGLGVSLTHPLPSLNALPPPLLPPTEKTNPLPTRKDPSLTLPQNLGKLPGIKPHKR